MNNRKWKTILLSLALDAILATELSLLLDAIGVFFERRMTPVIFVCVWVAALAGMLLCRRWTNRGKLRTALAIPGGVVLVGLLFFGIWNGFRRDARYTDVDTGKEKVYGNRSVMVIVPHQDDEYNILGGVIEEFVNYGSTVRVVYVTNGDGDGVPAAGRYRDALDYCASAGIPEENAIFLGYGDLWTDPGPDIYNAEPDTVLTSVFGATRTFGAEFHPAYREGRDYTLNNLREDMTDVILEYTPELIFCIDYDRHIGHMSTTLLFDGIMGQILKQNPDYRPLVMKGYAYGTAWFAQNDFFRLNILSTQDLFSGPYHQSPAVYSWGERIRFPVDSAILSRSAVNSGGYDSLGKFATQPAAKDYTPSVVNGDKVFWQRRTDSLLTLAGITVSSGRGELLNNFMIVDNKDLKNQEDPFDSVWLPEGEDPEKSIRVELAEPSDISSILLYDHPSARDNVLDARIEFDDGTWISTGPLHATGAATEIPVNKRVVESFVVTLAVTEGENPGLTELEAYATEAQGDLAFVKIMDENGDFAYDYWLPRGDTVEFGIYSYGNVSAPDSGSYSVTSDNAAVKAELVAGTIRVTCPRGETAVLTLTDGDSGAADAVCVRNPGMGKRAVTLLGQRLENFARFHYQRLMAWRLVQRVDMILNKIF